MKRFVRTSSMVLLLMVSCSPTPDPRLQIGKAYAVNGTTYKPHIQPHYKEIGYASWYGSRFHKKQTANGEVFNKNEYTAAHKTLPLPSIVKVTNLNNGRSVKVRVNDRGPFKRGRIIDVSEAAAAQLGFRGRGLARVSVELDRAASIELMKDPRLKIKEAEKKLILEAYRQADQNMSPFVAFHGNQSEKVKTEDVVVENLNRNIVREKVETVQEEVTQADAEATRKLERDKIAASQQKLSHNPNKMNNVPVKPISLQSRKVEAADSKLPKSMQKAETETPTVATGNGVKQDFSKKAAGLDSSSGMNSESKSSEEPISENEYTDDTNSAAPIIKKNRDSKINDTPAEKTFEPAKSASGNYSIQVASTTSETDAENIAAKFKDLSSNIEPANVNGKNYFRVRIVELASETAAGSVLNKVKARGYKDAYIIKPGR